MLRANNGNRIGTTGWEESTTVYPNVAEIRGASFQHALVNTAIDHLAKTFRIAVDYSLKAGIDLIHHGLTDPGKVSTSPRKEGLSASNLYIIGPLTVEDVDQRALIADKRVYCTRERVGQRTFERNVVTS